MATGTGLVVVARDETDTPIEMTALRSLARTFDADQKRNELNTVRQEATAKFSGRVVTATALVRGDHPISRIDRSVDRGRYVPGVFFAFPRSVAGSIRSVDTTDGELLLKPRLPKSAMWFASLWEVSLVNERGEPRVAIDFH